MGAFERLYTFLDTSHLVTLMAMYIVLHGLAVLLRVAVHLGYRIHNNLVNADLKRNLGTLDDAKNLSDRLLRKVADDYRTAAEKNAPRVPMAELVERHVL